MQLEPETIKRIARGIVRTIQILNKKKNRTKIITTIKKFWKKL
jgi:hypothetical protein